MRLRPPTNSDAERVQAVLLARDMADFGQPDLTLGDPREEWSAGEFDLRADARVAEDSAGRVLAYAVVRRPGAVVAVHPEHERRGIGTQLLHWSEARERQRGRSRHRQWVAAGNEPARSLLTAAGYRYTRSYYRMVRPLDGAVSEPLLPPGVRLRQLDVPGDAAELHVLDGASFAANADYEPEPLEAFEEHLRAGDADPTLSLVAGDGTRAIGFLLTRRWNEQGVGFVDVLAVHPDFQRRGVGTALLRRAFARYVDAGLRQAQLGVASDNPRARALYERIGMQVEFRYDTYEKPAVVADPAPG